MTDTSPHIRKLQLEILLPKSPMERLKKLLLDNEALYLFQNNTKDREKKPEEKLKNNYTQNKAF